MCRLFIDFKTQLSVEIHMLKLIIDLTFDANNYVSILLNHCKKFIAKISNTLSISFQFREQPEVRMGQIEIVWSIKTVRKL